MNDRTIVVRLIWKDARIILPLVRAALLAVVGLNLSMYSIWPQPDELAGWAIPLWYTMPNFVALGAAAMLVGSEEDNGTMDWLRTLPVGWQQVAAIKFWVAAGAVLLTFACSSLTLYLISLGWEIPPRAGPSLEAPTLHTALVMSFYTSLLLLLGFVTAYSIRQPLMALLALIPLYVVVAFGWTIVGAILSFENGVVSPRTLIASVGLLFLIWLLQHGLARRRLLLPRSNLLSRVSAVVPASSDYRPSSLPVPARPSEVASLLWQQTRQTAPMIAILVGVSSAAFLLLPEFHRRGLGLLVFEISVSSLGALVFFGDSRFQRHSFFADRGISPTRIWWTRLLPPGLGFLFLLAVVIVVNPTILGTPTLQFIGFSVVLFAFGQLVSQWSRRPILAFFAAPAYAWISLTPVFYLASRLGSHVESIVMVVPLLVSPVLLFASWQLTRSWLEGRDAPVNSAKVIAYTALAVLMPCLWIVGQHLMPLATSLLAESMIPWR